MSTRFATFTGRTAQDTKGCTVRGCRQEPSKDKPYCSAHLDRLPYVKALRSDTSPKAIGTPPIDGYLRLLERVGLVKIEKRGARRVALWHDSRRLARSAS